VILVSRRISTFLDREEVDEQAKKVVVAAYREANRNRARAQEAFDAAVDSYASVYPHINRKLTSQAVAYILSTVGV
jgi:hypothetical protein